MPLMFSPTSKSPTSHQQHPSVGDDLTLIYYLSFALAILGLLGAGLYAYANGDQPPGLLSILGGAALIGGASAFVGGLVGFLFAIPRSRQGQDNPQAIVAVEGDGTRRLSDYAANTNLEQISDWLTKILVGISLVQFRAIAGQIGAAGTLLAPMLGQGVTARPMALSLMTYFSVWGFFAAYLGTRLWLPKALSRAEREEQVRKHEVEKEAELRAAEMNAYNVLYAAAPEGFTRAIDIIERHIDKPGSLKSASLYLYLAAAYGQKHAFLGADGPEADSARRNGVAAVREALRLGPETRPVLVQLYQGVDSNENDLVTLKGPEMDELLGAP